MSHWIELRCNVRGPRCYSHNNHGPKILSGSRRDDLKTAMGCLKREALHLGWSFKNGEWSCPNCRTRPLATWPRP